MMPFVTLIYLFCIFLSAHVIINKSNKTLGSLSGGETERVAKMTQTELHVG